MLYELSVKFEELKTELLFEILQLSISDEYSIISITKSDTVFSVDNS